jgi:hypothetical protein
MKLPGIVWCGLIVAFFIYSLITKEVTCFWISFFMLIGLACYGMCMALGYVFLSQKPNKKLESFLKKLDILK